MICTSFDPYYTAKEEPLAQNDGKIYDEQACTEDGMTKRFTAMC